MNERVKDEIIYNFYNEYGLCVFSTKSKKEAKKFLKHCDIVEVNGHIAKFPVLNSFWCSSIINYTIRERKIK